MQKGLLDTNIITAVFRGIPQCVQKYEEYLEEHGTIHLSVIAYYELYRGLLDIGSKKKLDRFKEFTENAAIYYVNKPVAEKASELYVKLKKKGMLIQDADLLIAATALVHGFCVITNNESHFSRIKGLKVKNWLK